MNVADQPLKALEALSQLHEVLKKVQPPLSTGPRILQTIEHLYLHLLNRLKQEAPEAFASLENMLANHKASSSFGSGETIAASSLWDIFLGLDIQEISFEHQPQKDVLNIAIPFSAPVPKEAVTEKAPQHPEPVKTQEESREAPLSRETEKEEAPSDLTEVEIFKNLAEIKTLLMRLIEIEGTSESYFSTEQKDIIKRLSNNLIMWLEKQTQATPGYQEICQNLQAIVESFIVHKLFAEAHLIIHTFCKIKNGQLQRDDNIRNIALDFLRNVATEKNIEILFREININEKNNTTEAYQILSGFGEIAVKKLLNSIREATDSKERIRIIHIIQEIGEKAIPIIKETMTVNAPWFYLRNMAYILGRIGNENTVDILRPLLLHHDKRVCLEAFKSVISTGGKNRGPLLLSVIYQVDQDLRLDIIEALGKIRCKEAVTDLLYILKSKSSLSKEYQTSLQEKICNALGAIGSPEAIPALTEIAESKSFLGLQSYSTEVKYAAKRALKSIKKVNVLD